MLRSLLFPGVLGLGLGAMAACAGSTEPRPELPLVSVVDLDQQPATTARVVATPPAPLAAENELGSVDDAGTPPEDEPARQVGILGVLSPQGDAGDLASIFGTTGLDVDGGVWGGLIGSQIGDAYGAGGLGLTGTGLSAGGTSQGTIGLGSMGTIGHGGGMGGLGYGRGAGGLSGPRPRTSTVQIGSTAIAGTGLPPEVIRRIVRQHLSAFRYCYEVALKKTPDLAAKVSTRFIIGPTGAVSKVQDAGSSCKDAALRSCVQDRFRSMQFPKPEAGKTLSVVYPLRFEPASAPPTP